MKHFFVTAVLTLCALSATAHYKDCPHWEEIQSKKIAHINEKVQFTVKEAQLFWPLYNEYLEKDYDSLRLEYNDLVQSYIINATVFPPEYSEDEKFVNNIISNIQEQNSNLTDEEYLVLPDTVDGKDVVFA